MKLRYIKKRERAREIESERERRKEIKREIEIEKCEMHVDIVKKLISENDVKT